MEHVYCKSKIYSQSSSWFLNAFVLVQGKRILEVIAYELDPSECHLNSGLLKGYLGLFLRCFGLFDQYIRKLHFLLSCIIAGILKNFSNFYSFLVL